MTPIFIDFEASGLSRGSFPIEIAWVGAEGAGEVHLIRPAPAWLRPSRLSNWSSESEAVHKIPMRWLLEKGEDHAAVAVRAAEVLAAPGVTVYADSPYDGRWLACLFATAGLSESVQVHAVTDAYEHACRPLLSVLPLPDSPDRRRAEAWVRQNANELISAAFDAEECRPGIRHRALPDAESLHRAWMHVAAGAQARAAARDGVTWQP